MNVPVMNVAFNNPKRNKILAYVAENGQVSKKDFVDFLKKMNEEEGSNFGWGYVKSHAYFFKVKESKETGEKFVTLSRIGQNVLRKTTVNECEEVENRVLRTEPVEDFTDLSIKILSARSGIDITNYDIDSIKIGLVMTLENNGDLADSKFNVFSFDLDTIFRIVIGNLDKDKNYYLKLSQEQFTDWPSNEEEPTDDRTTAEYNKLFNTIEDEAKEDEEDQDQFDDMIKSAVKEEVIPNDVDDSLRLEKIAKVHQMSAVDLKKEFELGLAMNTEGKDFEVLKAEVLTKLAENPRFYSEFARAHWNDLDEIQKKKASEAGVMMTPNFTFPMPEPVHEEPEQIQAPATGTTIKMPTSEIAPTSEKADSDEIVKSTVDDEDADDDKEREEWEPENTGEEQPLFDEEERETLLTKEQKDELKRYMKENDGKISDEKISDFSKKFKVEEATLKAYININKEVKESYEIGKRYTINGHTGIVIAESEDRVVMSQHGKMLLLEKEIVDEFC